VIRTVTWVYTALYAATDTSGAPERPLTSVVYDELKRRLLLGEFRLGQRLGEVALAERLAVSRTPIREALTRLHAEGFVVRLPEGGFSPAAPDLHTIAELYVVRRGLELTAMYSGGGHDSTQLEDLRDEWAQMEAPPEGTRGDPAFVLFDEDFHIRLAGSSGNRSLVEILTRVSERIRVVRMYDFLTPDRIRTTIEEHLTIVGSLIERNLRTTERLLTRLVRISQEIAERRSAEALSRMVYGRSRDD
jgi:DNA-binding GntR family transcriptional regulator